MSQYIYPDQYGNCAPNTMDDIRKICENCCERDVVCISRPVEAHCPPLCPPLCPPSCPPSCPSTDCHKSRQHRSGRYDPGVSYFTSVITPLTNLTPGHSGCLGSVEFRMRRKNKTVTLQWEPFTGCIAASGITHLTVAQSICNTPPYVMSFPIFLHYKNTGRITHIKIDPHAKSGNIKFFLHVDGSGSGVSIGDFISVPGGSVSWIVD